MASNGHLQSVLDEMFVSIIMSYVLLDTDTTTYTEELGDERDLVGGLDLYT